MTENQWYDNKDLFEMIQVLKKEIGGLMNDLTQTRQEIKTYNNLRGTMNTCMSDLQAVKTEVQEQKIKLEGKRAFTNGIVTWTGWGVMLLTFASKLFGWW